MRKSYHSTAKYEARRSRFSGCACFPVIMLSTLSQCLLSYWMDLQPPIAICSLDMIYCFMTRTTKSESWLRKVPDLETSRAIDGNWVSSSAFLLVKYCPQFCLGLHQGCQTYGPRAKSGPLRGWIRPAGWFCEIKTSLFAWEVYPVVLQW